MAEAMTDAMGVLLLGGGLLDGRALRTGDGAEELTLEVATKREEYGLGPCKRNSTPRLL